MKKTITPKDRILRPNAVQHMLSVGKTKLYELMKDPNFPDKVRLGSRAIGFKESDILDWIDSRTEAATEEVAAA